MNNLKKIIIFFSLILVVGLTIGCSNVSITTLTTPSVTTEVTITETTSLTTTNGYIGIAITENTKTEYAYGEDFDEDSINVVILTAGGQTLDLRKDMYEILGFDSTNPGENTITVTYSNFSTSFIVTILENTNSLVLSQYYKSAESLVGNDLLLELRKIINEGKVNVSYDDARYILDETDRDPNNPNNLILVYTRESVPGEWNYPAWNREHIWPQSLLGNDSVMTSDLHNLKPSDVDENGFRANKYYDNVSSSVAYKPHDDVIGDVARILFYMVVMYEGLELVDQAPTTYQMGLLEVLISWHESDPVDEFERNRNDVIYQYQKNRNPFIDYPEFVSLIFG